MKAGLECADEPTAKKYTVDKIAAYEKKKFLKDKRRTLKRL